MLHPLFHRTFARVAGASLPTLAIFAMLGVSSPEAYGQLRSGKVERHLYQISDTAMAEESEVDYGPQATQSSKRVVSGTSATGGRDARPASPAGKSNSNKRNSPAGRNGVVHASYAQEAVQGNSILEAAPNMTANSGEEQYVEPEYVEEVAQPMHMHQQHCGYIKSGSCGCDSCSDFSQLAPTCAAACPPGCGPLMALWYRMRVRGEVPLYWRRAAAPPALVTTSAAGTDQGIAGELGQASTTTLLGGILNEDLTAGGRITLSTWIDPAEEYGLQFRYWNAGDQDDTFRFDSSTNAILARPFFNTTVAGAFQNDALLVSFPNQLSGNIQVESSSSVEGLELQLRRRLYQDRFTRVDWISGYQHVSIDEGMVIGSSTTDLTNNQTIAVQDSFFTDNSFHGGSYGFISSRNVACWKMETMFRLGMGNLRREVDISGSTTTTSAGLANTTQEGLLARSTNSRNFVDDTFIVVPEVGFTLAYALRPGWDFTVGYNYMFIPKVAQASQQINDNLAVNLSDPLTGQLDPGFTLDERNYWLHSLGLGLQVRY